MTLNIQRVIDSEGRVLELHQDIRPVYSNPDCPMLVIEDPRYLVGHIVYNEWATIDGRSADERQVKRFIRQSRERADA